MKPFLKKVKEKERFLDLGCGNGRVFLALKDKKVDYIGVDFSKELIAQAQKRFPEAKFILADLTEESLWKKLGKEKFDKVFLVAVLHHFPTPLLQEQLLKRINIVLKEDGQLFLTVWNLWQKKFWQEHFKQLGKKIISGFKLKWLWVPYRLSDGREVKREVYRFCYAFSKKELKNLLEGAGFKIEALYFSRKGKEVNWFKGFNLCVKARK